jgi:hypothetical protein
MARIAIDAALGSGFGLIRRRPGSVVLWGVVQFALVAAAFAVLAPFYLNLFAQIAAAAKSGTEPASQSMTAMMPQIMAIQGWIWLLNLISLFTHVVLYCAVFRAVLHPEQSRFAYLRLGMAELLLFVLLIALYVVFFVALVVGIIVIGLLAAALVAMHATAAAVILGVLAGLAAVVVLVWFMLRFSMVGPMTVNDGKFHLGESWTLTKGHAGVLLVLTLCLIAIFIIGEILIGGILLTVGVAMLSAAAGGLGNLTAFFSRPPAEFASALAPMLVVAAVILTPVAGCVLAIWGAPWARAYLDLTAPEPQSAAAAI